MKRLLALLAVLTVVVLAMPAVSSAFTWRQCARTLVGAGSGAVADNDVWDFYTYMGRNWHHWALQAAPDYSRTHWYDSQRFVLWVRYRMPPGWYPNGLGDFSKAWNYWVPGYCYSRKPHGAVTADRLNTVPRGW